MREIMGRLVLLMTKCFPRLQVVAISFIYLFIYLSLSQETPAAEVICGGSVCPLALRPRRLCVITPERSGSGRWPDDEKCGKGGKKKKKGE